MSETRKPLIPPLVIWLTPICENCYRGLADDILWCEDAQDDCPSCGKPWIRYTRDVAAGELK